MAYPDKHFFDVVRKEFRKLSQEQVEGLNTIVRYMSARGVPRAWLAYMLATTHHETAKWMWPIREGAFRYGTKYTDHRARRAVAALAAKGIIRYDYARPHANGHSYYGRGLVQITHKSNYDKFGIGDNPDKALEWEHALDIMYRGMVDGMFRKMSLKDLDPNNPDYFNARDIINGDKNIKRHGVTIGREVARLALMYDHALKHYVPEKK